jgi:hypothetical protein
MEVAYCDNCAARLNDTQADVESSDGKKYCEKCAPLFKFTTSALIAVQLPAAEETKPKLVSKFYFCETCGKRITDVDLEKGAGRDKKLKGVYCSACAAGVMTMEFTALTDQKPHGTGTTSAAPAPKPAPAEAPRPSGLHRVPPKPVDVHARPPSVRKPPTKAASIVIPAGIAVIAAILLIIFLSHSQSNTTAHQTAAAPIAPSQHQPPRPVPVADRKAEPDLPSAKSKAPLVATPTPAPATPPESPAVPVKAPDVTVPAPPETDVPNSVPEQAPNNTPPITTQAVDDEVKPPPTPAAPATSAPTPTPPPTPKAAERKDAPALEPGLIASYFKGSEFKDEDLVLTRIDTTIHMDKRTEAPAPGVPGKNHCIRWIGFLKISKAGHYTIAMGMSPFCGSRMWLDDKLLFDKYQQDKHPHGENKPSGEMDLSEGMHKIRVEFAAYGWNCLTLQYSLKGGFAEKAIFSDVLFHDPKLVPPAAKK